MPKKIKKKNKKMYFDQDVQDAIVSYNAETNHIVRNKIYSEKIAYAIDKLVENIINTFKFSYFDSHFNDVKQEVVSFIVLNMHKYNHEKGFKAFSYFSVVAKNYLILLNNGNYKKLKSHSSITDYATTKKLDDTLPSYIYESRESELMKEIVLYFENQIPKIFKKNRDVSIAFSIIDLLKNKHNIENFNKKGLYILVREMTGEKTARITKIINVMKKKYRVISKEFNKKGHIRDVMH